MTQWTREGSDFVHSLSVAAVSPRPILVCRDSYGEQVADQLDAVCTYSAFEIIKESRLLLQYRGVALDRLPVLLRTARDAEPLDGVFWSSDRIEKALEYGGREQVVIAYDPRRLKSARVDISFDTPDSERAELERYYPTFVSQTGNVVTRSRLPASEYHNGISYDHYARWIPGDPFDALIMMIAVGRPDFPVVAAVNKMIEECPAPIWRQGAPEERAAVIAKALTRRALRE